MPRLPRVRHQVIAVGPRRGHRVSTVKFIDDATTSQSARCQRGEEIHGLIADPAAALQRCSQKAVDEHSGESGGHRNPEVCLRKHPAQPLRPQQSPDRLPGRQCFPELVMPPSVPAGTRCQVVISRASALRYCPISLATVSVAASARAATAATNQTRFPVALKTTEPAAATARLARICHAFRPSRRSATPSASLRRYPRRVDTQVITNNAASVAKATGRRRQKAGNRRDRPPQPRID